MVVTVIIPSSLWFVRAELFYTRGNRDPERLSGLPKVTQPEGLKLRLKSCLLIPESCGVSVVRGFLPH